MEKPNYPFIGFSAMTSMPLVIVKRRSVFLSYIGTGR